MIILLFMVSIIVFAEPLSKELEVGNHYFTADWCGACKVQTPIITELQKQGYDIKIYKEWPDELNIKTLPTIIIVKINKKGKKVILKLKGVQPLIKLKKLIEKEMNDNSTEQNS